MLPRVLFIGPILHNTLEYSVLLRLPVLLNWKKCMFHIDVLAGEPTTCYVFRQSFKTLLKHFEEGWKWWLWISEKRNVSACIRHEVGHWLYVAESQSVFFDTADFRNGCEWFPFVSLQNNRSYGRSVFLASNMQPESGPHLPHEGVKNGGRWWNQLIIAMRNQSTVKLRMNAKN